jgi:DNA-binding NarL/FixJ family response regulator
VDFVVKVFFLADDEVVKSVKQLLKELLPNWNIVGQKPFSTLNIVSQVIKLEPDVIIVQHKNSDHRIITAVQQIKKQNFEIRVLMLLFDEKDFWSAIETRSDGYVIWPTTFLTKAVEVLMNGGVWLGPMVMEYLLRGEGFGVLRTSGLAISSPPEALESLSPRERQVLSLVAGGLSNKQVAASLNLTVGTVKVHVRKIFGKLNLRNRSEAISKFSHLERNSPIE